MKMRVNWYIIIPRWPYDLWPRTFIFFSLLYGKNGKVVGHKKYAEYTRSEWILNYKFRSVTALCDCAIFNMPESNDRKDPRKTCSVQHFTCLINYKSYLVKAPYFPCRTILTIITVKWSSIMSDLFSIVALEREMEESLLCRVLPIMHEKQVSSNNILV